MPSRRGSSRRVGSNYWYRLRGVASKGPIDVANADDAELLARIKQGERSALEVLFARWEGPLVAFFYRLGCPAAVIEELTEEVLVLAYRRRHRYDVERPFAPWVYGIARLVWKDYLRSRGRGLVVAAPLAAAENLPSEEAGPFDAADARETLKAVHAAVQLLPEDLREVFVLRHYQGLQYKEMAETLRVPIGTVKWRLHEAVRRLASISQLRGRGWTSDEMRRGRGDDD